MVTRHITAAGEHRCMADGSLLPLSGCSFEPARAGAAPRAVKLVVEPGSCKLKNRPASWVLYDHFPNDVASFRLASSGVKISQLSIVSEEEDWREGQLKAGAAQSNAGERAICAGTAGFGDPGQGGGGGGGTGKGRVWEVRALKGKDRE